MPKYTGLIKSKQQAARLASILEKVLTPEARGAALMLRRNWQSVAARPDLAARVCELAQANK